MRIIVLALILCTCLADLQAQKNIATEEQAWFAAMNQTRLSDRWGIWFDAHLRLKEDFVGDLAQGIARVGPTFYLNDDLRLTAAYAYVHTFPSPGHANIGLPEHRPWQQVQWFARWPQAQLMQWMRLEERFRRKTLNDNVLGEGYQFNWRIRHNIALFLPLTKKRFEPQGFQLVLNNELFVNFGKNIVYNHFDQNRFFLGLAYQASKYAQVQGGYMHLYQQLPPGDQFRNQHTVRLVYLHNFDFRKR